MPLKGNNTLTINQATMLEAMQFWLEKQVWKDGDSCPLVTNVKSDKDHHSEGFVVTLNDPETK